jgi:3-hydroxyacyl-[acyl-carrier-protein] dehydratase
MKKDNYFELSELSVEDYFIRATIVLNENHAIFEGHFPGKPVLPGACMMQIVKEILSSALNLNLQITKADSLKFIRIINPNENKVIQMDLNYSLTEEKSINVKADLLVDSFIFFKFRGVFEIGFKK